MKSSVFWDIEPCSQLKANRRFRESWRPHFQSRKISPARNRTEAGSMQSSRSSETRGYQAGLLRYNFVLRTALEIPNESYTWSFHGGVWSLGYRFLGDVSLVMKNWKSTDVSEEWASPCHLLSSWSIARLILRGWRRHVPPKRRQAFNGIYSTMPMIVLSLITDPFLVYLSVAVSDRSALEQCLSLIFL
jgi:hypothetical protein